MSQLKFLNAELVYAMHMLKHSTKATTVEIMWKNRVKAIQEEIADIKENVFSTSEENKRMAYKTFEYSLDEFSDEELIEELNSRSISTYHHSSKDIKNAIDCYRRGDIKETMIYLERAFPEFYNISKKVNL